MLKPLKKLNRLAVALAGLIVALVGQSALAQAACPAFVPAVTKDCTTAACTFDACWPTPQDLTGCSMVITTPTGVLPAISGTVNATKDHWTFVAPKLITGLHSINANGINAYGAGPVMPVPLALTTGAPPTAPSTLVVQ